MNLHLLEEYLLLKNQCLLSLPSTQSSELFDIFSIVIYGSRTQSKDLKDHIIPSLNSNQFYCILENKILDDNYWKIVRDLQDLEIIKHLS